MQYHSGATEIDGTKRVETFISWLALSETMSKKLDLQTWLAGCLIKVWLAGWLLYKGLSGKSPTLGLDSTLLEVAIHTPH